METKTTYKEETFDDPIYELPRANININKEIATDIMLKIKESSFSVDVQNICIETLSNYLELVNALTCRISEKKYDEKVKFVKNTISEIVEVHSHFGSPDSPPSTIKPSKQEVSPSTTNSGKQEVPDSPKPTTNSGTQEVLKQTSSQSNEQPTIVNITNNIYNNITYNMTDARTVNNNVVVFGDKRLTDEQIFRLIKPEYTNGRGIENFLSVIAAFRKGRQDFLEYFDPKLITK